MVLANKKVELSHGVVLIVIAKRRNVNLSAYATETPSIQRSYESRLLQNMGFRLSGKVWKMDEDPESDEDPGTRIGK